MVIEANKEILLAATEFAADKGGISDGDVPRNTPTTVLPGFWQDVVRTLPDGCVDGILFDVYPLTQDELVDGECDSFFSVAHRLLRPGGVFTFYYDVVESWIATNHVWNTVTAPTLRQLGFDVSSSEVAVTPKPNCEYFWKDRFLVPRAVKQSSRLGHTIAGSSGVEPVGSVDSTGVETGGVSIGVCVCVFVQCLCSVCQPLH